MQGLGYIPRKHDVHNGAVNLLSKLVFQGFSKRPVLNKQKSQNSGRLQHKNQNIAHYLKSKEKSAAKFYNKETKVIKI